MSHLLIPYFLEATLVWAALLVFYHFAFRHSSAWRTRRGFLLIAFGLGCGIPLLPSIALGGPVAVAQLPADLFAYLVPAVETGSDPATTGPTNYSWATLSLIVWLTGVVVGLGATVYRLAIHLRPVAKISERFQDYRVIRSLLVHSPYAAFGRIYLPEALDPELERMALLHEAAHLRAGHPYERLLLLAAAIVLWFHPLVWIYTRLLGEVQEFEADSVVAREVSPKIYGRQLLLATQSPGLVPALFSSPVKKRITMLTQPTTPHQVRAIHWTVLILLLGTLIVACTAEDLGDEIIPTAEAREFSLPELHNDQTAPVPENEEYSTFLHGFYAQVRYPAPERNAQKTGNVSVELHLSAEGAITYLGTEVVRESTSSNEETLVVIGYSDTEPQAPSVATAEDGLDEEVERAIRSIGNFKPATQNGEPVASVFKFGVRFGLEERME
ncbi:MAG: M56 family metallopeptidase [Lewinella sp.]